MSSSSPDGVVVAGSAAGGDGVGGGVIGKSLLSWCELLPNSEVTAAEPNFDLPECSDTQCFDYSGSFGRVICVLTPPNGPHNVCSFAHVKKASVLPHLGNFVVRA
jgi:hypothetical protein